MGFWDTNESLHLGQTIRPYDNQQNKENLQNYGLYCLGVKFKETEKKDRYFDLARELKK